MAGLRVGSWVMRTQHARRSARSRRHCWLAREAGQFDGCFQLGELHFSERQQDMVFAREIIEKSAFTDVGGLRDVLDSRFAANPF